MTSAGRGRPPAFRRGERESGGLRGRKGADIPLRPRPRLPGRWSYFFHICKQSGSLNVVQNLFHLSRFAAPPGNRAPRRPASSVSLSHGRRMNSEGGTERPTERASKSPSSPPPPPECLFSLVSSLGRSGLERASERESDRASKRSEERPLRDRRSQGKNIKPQEQLRQLPD